jgi:hypothetical protein
MPELASRLTHAMVLDHLTLIGGYGHEDHTCDRDGLGSDWGGNEFDDSGL